MIFNILQQARDVSLNYRRERSVIMNAIILGLGISTTVICFYFAYLRKQNSKLLKQGAFALPKVFTYNKLIVAGAIFLVITVLRILNISD